MKKLNKQRLFILVMTLITLTILFFFLKNIIVEIIKFQIDNNPDGIKELLADKGLFGLLSVILVEGLQMVIVFISAEFIQISAGISYPWYIAMPLCSIGILLGASIIYMLCNLTKFDGSIFKKQNAKIENFSKKSNNAQLLMYILFVTPVIPFGAICYFGANAKISYKRYIFTCLTGTIPSIVTSIFLGKIISYAILKDISIWYVVLAVVLIMLLLLIACAVLINKTILKANKNTPDSPVYNVLLKVFKLRARKTKYVKDDFASLNIDGPFLILSNHPSGLDVYFIADLVKPVRLSFILNHYFYRFKIVRFILTKIGVITKKLFTPDIKTIKGTLKAVKDGYPVYMCPEGRLGLDGTNYYITKETGKFVKQLKLPVVIVTINGAYISKPKWRKHRIKSDVTVRITKYLTKEEVIEKSSDEINDIINEGIRYNEFDYILENGLTFKDKKKALGLENVLYMCPKCHKEFKIETSGNQIKCAECGFNLEIMENYHFNQNELNITNIHDWYNLIKQTELNKLDDLYLECDVKVHKYNIDNKKLDEDGFGKCILTNKSFKFVGNLKVKEFEIDIVSLRALAFSTGVEFECYHDSELYYFYPLKDRAQCAKWALLVDLLVEGADTLEKQ